MHKILLLLGMLLQKPLYGYELHRIIRAHGELYTDLKKANLYYLLERLASDGYLSVQSQAGTRGARGERLIYELTNLGRERFNTLLYEVMLTYEPVHIGVDTAIVFLSYLPRAEGFRLLQERRGIVAQRRTIVAADLGEPSANAPLVRIAGDHLLSLIDAEIAWIDRSLLYLQDIHWVGTSSEPSQHQVTKAVQNDKNL